MCSVVGYIGKDLCQSFVLEGLSRLEYRGYDSAGFACLSSDNNRLLFAKAPGRLNNLQQGIKASDINGHVGVGHTRWATHGISNQVNAHPQFNCDNTISVVHNGIIENYCELREQLLQAGHTFHSETDTEVIAHLLESLIVTHKTFKAAIDDLVNRLNGAYAFIAILENYPNQMVLVRKRSPLCIGIGDDEMFIASDSLAFAGRTNKVLFLPDESYALISKDMIDLYDFAGNSLPLYVQKLELSWSDFDKSGHEHYMLKEMYEQKNSIHKTIHFFDENKDIIWDQLGMTSEQAKQLEKMCLVGCGTSWHAARIGQFFFEQICEIPAPVFLASEFRYMTFFKQQNSLFLALSQSGETADTLEALRFINSMNIPTAALTNVASSTMVREAGGFFLTQAGPEIAVASTKSFSTQIAALYWFAHRLALEKGIINQKAFEHAKEEVLIAAEVLENSLENYKYDIQHVHAKFYAQFKKAIFLGRHVSYPLALEAALKLKEIAYIFSQSYPSGELKHGPLALIDAETPTFLFSHLDETLYQKTLSNAQEVKARGGHLIVFAFEGQDQLMELGDLAFVFPKVNPLLGPLAMIGVIQFFVYAVAKELGREIDKPRNLAKSVTVE